MKRNKLAGRKLVLSDLTRPKGVGADVVVRDEPALAGTGDIPSVEEINKAAPPPPSPFEKLAHAARRVVAAQPEDPRFVRHREQEAAKKRVTQNPAEIIELPNELAPVKSLAEQIQAQGNLVLPNEPLPSPGDIKLKIPEIPTRAPKAAKKPTKKASATTKRKRCAVDDVQITINVSDLANLVSRASDIAAGRYDPVDAYRLVTALDVAVKATALRKSATVDPIIAYRQGNEQVNLPLSEVLVDIQSQMTSIVETAKDGVRDIL